MRPDPRELASRLLERDRAAVPVALNLADDARPEWQAAALELLETLEREMPSPGAARIGVTGAPGAGKSTLLDALVRELRPGGETLAIVAVDPSSRRSGGALLGDRARVRSGAGDEGVFIRSMAARERLGGLADAARAGVTILASVFDRVFVETVGVGQSETEVTSLVDTLVYVASPATGDILQFMKAGILEEPDVFVVNKADLGELAERTAGELAGGLGLGEPAGSGGWKPPLLLTSAQNGTGVAELARTLREHFEHQCSTGGLEARRRAGRARWVIAALAERYGSFGLERLGGGEALAARVARAASGTAALRELADEAEAALQRPRGS